MLEKPHHPHMVEGAVREGQLDRIGTTKVGTQAKASEVSPSCLQLAFLDVHSCQNNAGKRSSGALTVRGPIPCSSKRSDA